jgi:hypothetical protein
MRPSELVQCGCSRLPAWMSGSDAKADVNSDHRCIAYIDMGQNNPFTPISDFDCHLPMTDAAEFNTS